MSRKQLNQQQQQKQTDKERKKETPQQTDKPANKQPNKQKCMIVKLCLFHLLTEIYSMIHMPSIAIHCQQLIKLLGIEGSMQN